MINMKMKSRRRGTRKQSKHSSLYITLLAQTVLCVVMLALALTVSEYFDMTDIKPAFVNLITNKEEDLEVFSFVKEQVPKVDEFYKFLESYLGESEYSIAMGGENPVYIESPSVVFMNAKGVIPVSGIVTSPFGYRSHPITQKIDYHTGVDIGAPKNHPILASYPGIVEEVGESRVYGNYIILDHGNFKTKYAHCEVILATPSTKVRQGERIAKVGSTGVSTGPHVHFEIIKDGISLDPKFGIDI